MMDASVFEGMFFPIFWILFIIVIGILITQIIRNIISWNRNNHSPRLTVDSKVVSKRMKVTHSGNANGATSSHTTYYCTFEVNSGDRIELKINGYEYGMLVEGDIGKLSFQGSRYMGFERA